MATPVVLPSVTRRRRSRRAVANMRAAKTTTTMLMAALAAALAALAAPVAAVEIMFKNECGKDMVMSNGKTRDPIKKDSHIMKKLEVGAVEAFRYGTGNQATLAEFSVQNATTWYDIGIIPTGPSIGPGNCSSLADCKAATGGTGFNVPMKIVPGFQKDEFFSEPCMVVDCFEDGCEDAYQHPNDPGKTRNCPASAHFTVVFCATRATGESDGSLGWNGEFESAVIATPVPSTQSTRSTRAPASSEPPQVASTAHADDGDDGTSVAVIVASIVGGFVMVFAAVVLVRRFRYTRLEKMNAARSSSDAIMYTEVRDTSAL